MRTCKVYCTYFGNRRGGDTLSPSNADEALIVFKKNIDNDMVLDCGVQNMDIIIVNNKSEAITKECVDYLSEINGMKTPYGKIIVHNRENVGGSVAAYSYAFDQYENDYDYWLFIEDDIRMIYDGYMKMIVDEFEDEKLGFLAFTVIIAGEIQKEHPEKVAVGGGFGGCSRKILSEVKKKCGKLPWDEEIRKDNYSNIGHGERYFINSISQMGYEIRHPKNLEIIPLADNWDKYIFHVRWQAIKDFKFNLNNKKFLYHIGL